MSTLTPQELRAARNALGLTPEQLADEIAESPQAVRLWELGQADIPRGCGEQIAWLMEADRRQQALAASGLAECQWLKSWEGREPQSDEPSDHRKHFEELQHHQRHCQVCRAREQFLREGFGEMPPLPGARFGFLWRPLALLHEVLPNWARPPVWGALFLLVIVAGRLVFVLPLIVAGRLPLSQVLQMLIGAVGAGAGGGFAYTLVGRPLRSVPLAGPYLSGIVAVGGYCLALIVVAPSAFGERLVQEPSDWYFWASWATLFGAAFGHSALRPKGAV